MLAYANEFPSPQVGSEPVVAQLAGREDFMFPSPQVGSEPADTTLLSELRFYVSIPSSRVGTRVASRNRTIAAGFHPLKSGRNKGYNANPAEAATVSIPSSRVGTQQGTSLLSLIILFPSPQVGSEHSGTPTGYTGRCSFHPLKSGRNRERKDERGKGRVGFHPLKSGRNGEAFSNRFLWIDVSIPSSRVGTLKLRVDVARIVEFPSPQVGSELGTPTL